MRKLALIGVFIIGLVAVLAYFIYVGLTAPGDYDEFAACLAEKGFSMAGTDWCHYCADQKSLFGNSFRLVNYKNCDLEKSWCDSHGVTGYPTWIDSEGNTYQGGRDLETLSTLSGCAL